MKHTHSIQRDRLIKLHLPAHEWYDYILLMINWPIFDFPDYLKSSDIDRNDDVPLLMLNTIVLMVTTPCHTHLIFCEGKKMKMLTLTGKSFKQKCCVTQTCENPLKKMETKI